MNLHFAIPAWAACGPGLSTPAQWRAWAAAPGVPAGEVVAPLATVAPMVRRRLNALGRTVLQAASDVAGPVAPGTPTVFSSRYGDAARALDLLADLARGEPLSPAGFGLAVHNAIGATHGITRGDRSNQIAVAAGPASAAAALVEAVALLADGAPEVLVVHGDAPLPGAYGAFDDGPAALYAWAWRVTAPVAGAPSYRLEGVPAEQANGVGSDPADGALPPRPHADGALLPFALDLLRCVAGDVPHLTRTVGTTTWTWRRGDA